MKKVKIKFIIYIGLLLLNMNLFAQDSNFYIYLCFGQSNMEGQGVIEEQDKTVDSRFQVLQAMDCSNLNQIKGTWRTAVPPLCQCTSGLSPADSFPRISKQKSPYHLPEINPFQNQHYQTSQFEL